MGHNDYDVIVLGGGHAGCEAASAAAKIGCRTLLLTINLDAIALMPCNPAIGGLAKGHLVREIDALGGLMAKCIDETGIQFRMLNTGKGPAVRAIRAQADKQSYRLKMKETLEGLQGLSIKQGMVGKLLVEGQRIAGVETEIGEVYGARTVVLAPGTFLNGLIHIGLANFPAGRAGEFPSTKLSASLRQLGFKLGRLKTGTCPRIDANTIDFSKTQPQPGDEPPPHFSFATKSIDLAQVPCHLTYTNERTHTIIRANLDRSPLYRKVIKGIGPRYCPSIEDKVVRFASRDRHQVFLEPEGLNTSEVYPNGVSTSLPLDVQVKFLRTIEGLEEVEVMRPGYAVEYDFVEPTQLKLSLETKLIKGLFCAGQINGTSGYEEAAAQGLVAGANAALSAVGRPEFTLRRDEAYIGVMVDDLVTKGVDEPYRIFTSRAEYRLLLRQGNADLRLSRRAFEIGLLGKEGLERGAEKAAAIEEEVRRLRLETIKPSPLANAILQARGTRPISTPAKAASLLRRPEISYADLAKISSPLRPLSDDLVEEVETLIKYSGYVKRQEAELERMRKLEARAIPADLEFEALEGLSTEVREKLKRIRPVTLGQAWRIPGVTPSALSILLVHLEKRRREGLRGVPRGTSVDGAGRSCRGRHGGEGDSHS